MNRALRHRAWRSRSPRRGAVLIVAMVVLGSALFIGTSLISLLLAGSAVSAGSQDTASARAVARSALDAIAADLNRQRRAILRGDSPALDAEYVLFEDGDRLGVVRLQPIGVDGELLVAEAGKLDINLIEDAATLVATGLVLPALADEVIHHRDSVLGRQYQSEQELLAVAGMTPDILYGSVERLIQRDADANSADWSRDEVNPIGLADVVTVYGIEPALQENGTLRINLNVEWSDELRDRVAKRFGAEIASGLEQVFNQGVKFDNEQRMFELLRFFQVPPDEWHEATDSFTTEKADYHRGRLDLNTAPYEALRGLPGIEFEQAAQLAAAQSGLTAEERKTVAWPAMLDIVQLEQMDGLAGRITTRCWTWRIRFEAGMVSSDDIDGPLTNSAIYEAVIDLASPRPRIAYLRDVTLLSDVALIASTIDALLPAREFDPAWEEDALDEAEAGSDNASDDVSGGDDGGLDFGMDSDRDDSLDFGGSDRDREESGAGDEEDEEGSGDERAGGDAPAKPRLQGQPRIGRWAPGN